MLTSDDLLEEISPYATVDMFQSERDETWRACGSLRIRSKGANFKISSEFGHPTAQSALYELRDRVINVVNQASDLKQLGNIK